MAKKHSIVIAEDHTILRKGLRALLSFEADFEVVKEADYGLEAICRVEKYVPDLLLIDLSMPRMNGVVAIRDVKKRYPETKIIALTVHKAEEYIDAALKAGAYGYVLKDAAQGELVLAIRTVFPITSSPQSDPNLTLILRWVPVSRIFYSFKFSDDFCRDRLIRSQASGGRTIVSSESPARIFSERMSFLMSSNWLLNREQYLHIRRCTRMKIRW